MGKTFALRVGALRAIAEDRMVVTDGRMVVTEKCPERWGSLSGKIPVSTVTTCTLEASLAGRQEPASSDLTKRPIGGNLPGITPVSAVTTCTLGAKALLGLNIQRALT